jgi:hypothetical protein
MIHAFYFWDFSQSVPEFFLKFLTIIAAFVVVTHDGLKILLRPTCQEL